MLRRDSHTQGLFSSGDTCDNDCEMGASCREADGTCLCEVGPCTLYSEAHTPAPDAQLCELCGKKRGTITRHSEGYGTEEEVVLSDAQGDSDADADIEDTDCRLQEAGSLQRISSRRRKRPRVSRQDTTESEDDGGRSHRTHRWNIRPSPDRAHSRTILEESVSQVRPLVICRTDVERQKNGPDVPGASGRRLCPWPPSLSLSLPVILLLSLPVSLYLAIVIVSFFLPRASA